MKVKEGYVLREVAGNSIVVAIGDGAVDFNGLITINEVGTFLWKLLINGTTRQGLLRAVLEEYDIDEQTAQKDIDEFIEKLRQAGLMDE